MTPSTPPRSRQRRHDSGSLEMHGYGDSVLGTPQRSQLLAPVTPSTVQKFKSVPALQPQKTTFNGLKSPERSPFPLQGRRGSVKRTFGDDAGAGCDSGCDSLLGDASGKYKSITKTLFAEETEPLFPPETSTSPSRSSSPLQLPKLQLSHIRDAENDEQIRKMAKQVPGTPSDKVITFEMSQDWNNVSSKDGTTNSDTEDDLLVTKKPLKNPFASDDVIDETERRRRHNQLLKENPELESTISYVNKNGEVVKQRHLSLEDQIRYKPRALFTKEIEELKRDKK